MTERRDPPPDFDEAGLEASFDKDYRLWLGMDDYHHVTLDREEATRLRDWLTANLEFVRIEGQ